MFQGFSVIVLMIVLELNQVNCTFFPYGVAQDRTGPTGDDKVTTSAILLRQPVRIGDRIHNSLYFNTNGMISFSTSYSTNSANRFPNSLNKSLIAVYLSDLVNDSPGAIYYRESVDTQTRNLADEIITKNKDLILFRSKAVFILTFYKIRHFSAGGSQQRITFQAAIVSSDAISFLIYNYGSLYYPTRSSNVQIGFDAGNMKDYKNVLDEFNITDPRDMARLSNVGVAGQWVFNISSIDPCPAGFYGSVCHLRCGQCKQVNCSRTDGSCNGPCKPFYYTEHCNREAAITHVNSEDEYQINVTDITAYSALITWRGEQNITREAMKFYYYVVHCSSTVETSNIIQKLQPHNNFEAKFEVPLRDLQPNTSYNVFIAPQTRDQGIINIGKQSDGLTFNTRSEISLEDDARINISLAKTICLALIGLLAVICLFVIVVLRRKVWILKKNLKKSGIYEIPDKPKPSAIPSVYETMSKQNTQS